MKINKIALCVVFFFFGCVPLFGETLYFRYQQDINDRWQDINASNPSYFFGDFTINEEIVNMQSNSVLSSDDDTKLRTLRMKESSDNRFFSFASGVNNVVLTLNNISLADANYTGLNTQGGGAVYVAGSGFTLHGNASFDQNVSSVSGGAIYVASGTARFTGSVKFNFNYATVGSGSDGGALFSGGDIRFSSTSMLNASGNSAAGNGGALFAAGNIIIDGGAAFSENTSKASYSSGSGAGAYANGSIVFNSTSSVISLYKNIAEKNGGGLYSGSSVTFRGGAVIDSNKAMVDQSSTTVHSGGGIFAESNVSFLSVTALADIKNNTARDNGGGIYSSGTVTFAGNTNISANASNMQSGGGVWALNNISFTSHTASLTISSNSARESGGALYSKTGYVNIHSYANVRGNKTILNGGAVYACGFNLYDGGEFLYNAASSSGGAVFVNGGTSSIVAQTRDVLFSNNTTMDGNKKNDLHISASSVSATMALNAAYGRSITFNSGIDYDTDEHGNNTVRITKNGEGNLILNGDNSFQYLTVNGGSVTFGAESSFESYNTVFANNSFINMRNGNNSDDLKTDTLNAGAAVTLYYDINSDNNNSDIITVGGAAAMNGATVRFGVAGIDASSRTYRIIQSTNSLGTGQLNINLANADIYANVGKDINDPNEVIVSTRMTRVHAKLLYDGQAYSGSWTAVDLEVQIDQLNVLEGLTDNQLQNALTLDRDYGASTGDLFYIIDQIDRMQTVSEKKSALNDLSGHFYANVITLPAINVSRNNVFSRLKRSYFLADDSSMKRNIWVQGYASKNKYNGDKNSPGDFDAENNGVLAGFDTMKNDKQIFGINFGYVKTSADQKSDSVTIEGYSIGGYGSYFFDNNFETKFMLAGARQNYNTDRAVRYLGRKASADFDGYSLNLSGELAYDYYYSDEIYLRPFIGLDYAYATTREFTEKGADSADLTIYSGSYNRAGGNFGLQVNNGTDMKLKWYTELKFDMLFAGRYGEFEGEYKNTEHSLKIVGIENDVLSAVLSVGALYDISSSISVYANVNGMYSGTQNGYYGNIGVNYKFATHYIDFYDR